MAAPSSPYIPAKSAARRPRRPLRQIVGVGLIGIMVLALAIQLVPYGHDHANPPVLAEPAWNNTQTRALFVRACADCHSNQTTWPWYSSVAPVSWLTVHDVGEGRREFNISEWGRQRNKGDEAAETVQKGEMPPWFYAMVHPTAQLTDGERQALIDGLVATFGERERGPGGEREGSDD
jgi:mono/diheme cytochrome c family protein